MVQSLILAHNGDPGILIDAHSLYWWLILLFHLLQAQLVEHCHHFVQASLLSKSVHHLVTKLDRGAVIKYVDNWSGVSERLQSCGASDVNVDLLI